MKNLVIAKRYARALFNLALQEQAVEQYGQELDQLVQLFRDLPDLADAIQNPLYPEATRKSVFNTLADRSGMTTTVKSFTNLLIEKKRAQNLGEISDYYRKLIDEHANVARATVKAATRLDEGVVQGIVQSLEKIDRKSVV